MTGLFSIAVKNAVNALASFNELCYNYIAIRKKRKGVVNVYITVKTTEIACPPNFPRSRFPKIVSFITAMKPRFVTAITPARDANQIYFL